MEIVMEMGKGLSGHWKFRYPDWPVVYMIERSGSFRSGFANYSSWDRARRAAMDTTPSETAR